MPSTDRSTIEKPLVLDFSNQLVPPLKTLLQQGYQPAGLVRRQPDGSMVTLTPWYAELAYPVDPESDTTGVLYVFPVDGSTNLLVASIGRAFDVLFHFLSGPDYGDALTSLVAKHWPHVYQMLLASQTTDLLGRIVGQVRTNEWTQWMVADPLRGGSEYEVTHAQFLDLLVTAVEVQLDALEFHLRLPGVLQVLGGPDQLSRRLSAIAGLFNEAASIAGEIKPTDDSIAEILTHLREQSG